MFSGDVGEIFIFKVGLYTGCPEKTERFELLKNIMLIYATVKH